MATLLDAARPLPQLLEQLGRDELKSLCRKSGLPDEGRARRELVDRLLSAAGVAVERPRARARELPVAGDIVQVRQREYLVEDVRAGTGLDDATWVELSCLDDDAQGRRVGVLWELELGARIIEPSRTGLGQITRLDEPRHFGAYLHALKWGCVTATDARLFQAPFRAGIHLMDYQLTPLKKALELPRVNLFIADDVGLGKTIEAGLVIQELVLRQRVEFTLVVCPASVALQWRGEMERRFGLRFEIFNREFVARRRQERGFAVNPWSTHPRFIVTYQTLRRPEYAEPLAVHLSRDGNGTRLKKSLLVLDEAHTAAPASAQKYAVDSDITHTIRALAPRFENRLFLSATPHNGHSNSFSSLLEILDPQRFTRGTKVRPQALRPVMVRRLKSDLRSAGSLQRFPERKVVRIALEHGHAGWRERHGEEPPRAIEGPPHAPELELSLLLAEYTRLCRPTKGRARLVFVNLQKRLLSSIEAFHRTLAIHAQSFGQGPLAEPTFTSGSDELPEGELDEALAEREEQELALLTRSLESPDVRARELLDQMLALAGKYRSVPDAKLRSLLAWMRRHQCEGLGSGRGRWTDRRIILFTEYTDTKRYLLQHLTAMAEGTHAGDERILQLHGGMGEERREAVQRAFNSPPSEHPVRILLATDAAREGINLQAHCADLFHFDVPWNPARMEQRNGRIDRTLQPAPEVHCRYFVYPQRTEDRVLEALTEKVQVIQRELGSLSAVVVNRLAEALEGGIDDRSLERLEKASRPERAEVVKKELEAERKQAKLLAREFEEVARIRAESQQVTSFEPELLKDAIDVGLELSGAKALEPLPKMAGGVPLFRVGELPPSWERTLDTLREPKDREERWSDWRKRPLLPVRFSAPEGLDSGEVQLHLAHPFVQRMLQRFLAQGFSVNDLSRVTVLRSRRDAVARVLAFGRLTLFGPGAVRLHDTLVSVAARWVEGGGKGHLKPFSEGADREALQQLEATLKESPSLDGVPEMLQRKLLQAAPGDFQALWPAIEAEAENEAHEAQRRLKARATEESDALRTLLEEQREAIQEELTGRQLELDLPEDRSELNQWNADKRHMQERLREIEAEIQREPAELLQGYRIVRRRVSAVGLVYLWPSTR